MSGSLDAVYTLEEEGASMRRLILDRAMANVMAARSIDGIVSWCPKIVVVPSFAALPHWLFSLG
jgi:hypothetical protein